MQNYRVFIDDKFFLEGPLETLRTVFDLHPDAPKRIFRTLETEVVVEVFFNGRSRFGFKSMIVQKAS